AGRVVEERGFDRRTLKYTYAKSSKLHRLELPDGTWREYAHDPLGNVLEEATPHGTQKYRRDKLGRLLEATVVEHSGKPAVERERDPLGRVIAEVQNGLPLKSSWDARSRRTRRELPGGETTAWTYDRAGAPLHVDHAGYRLAFERDVLGRESSRRAGKV